MRQGQNPKRSRGRGSGNRRNVPARHQTFDSNGPNVRIRGNAHQVHEKYLALARDASASGDRIAAENYMQHADHYFRIINLDSDDESHGRGRQHGHRHDQRGGNGRDSGDAAEAGRDGADSGTTQGEEVAAQPSVTAAPAGENAGNSNGIADDQPPGFGDQPEIPPAPKRRGRPPRAAARANGAVPSDDADANIQEDTPKPRRGRPPKTPPSETQPDE